MRSFIPLLAATLFSLTDAQGNGKQCLNFEDVQFYTGIFGKVMSQERGYKDLARRYFAKDLISSSDSFAFANELPMNQSLTTRDNWLEIISKTRLPEAETLFLSHTCDTITWYHQYQLLRLPVRCINVMTIDMKAKQITKNFWELNAAALLYQNGKPECKKGFEVNIGREMLRKSSADCNGSRSL